MTDAPAPTSDRDGLEGRIRFVGICAWTLIGVMILLYYFFRNVLSPVSVVFPPVAIAVVVVYLLDPVVSLLERRGLRRGLGVAVIYLLFIAVVSVVLSLVIPIIGRQVTGFVDELPTYLERVTESANDFAERRNLDFRIEVTRDEIGQWVSDNRDAIISFLGGVRSVASSVLHVLITLIIGMILSIYLLLDMPKIRRAVRGALPERRRAEMTALGERIGRTLGGFFRGQLLVATFVGVASALGLSLIKLPFAILVGLVAGIFNLVPLIGPFIGAIPAVALGLLSDQPSRALWAMLVLLIVQQIDNHIISPNVMGRTVQLHPITVMLALLAGGTVAGIFGMLLVVPGVAAAKIVGLHFWGRREAIAAAMSAPIMDAPPPSRG